MQVLPIADEVFLIGHDENSGKPQISSSALDTVLAGGVLAELVLTERIGVAEGTTVVAYSDVRTGDQARDSALSEIVGQVGQHHPVRAWVEHLRDSLPSMVAMRLVRAGLVERQEVRQMLKTSLRYPARDRMAAAAPIARLRYILDNPSNLDEHSAALAGLVVAAGLEVVFGGASPREVRQNLVQMSRVLRPELAMLIAGVESAVAALAMRAGR